MKNGWKHVEFRSAVGPILEANGLGYKDMGHYDFIKANGDVTRADYTFAYHKVDGGADHASSLVSHLGTIGREWVKVDSMVTLGHAE